MSSRRLLGRKLRRDLQHRRAQVVAVSLTVFVGITVFVLAAGMASNLANSYDLTYDRTAFADVWVTGGPPDMAEILEGFEAVERIEQRTLADVGVQFTDRPITTRIVGFGADTTLNSLVITSGAGIDPDGRGVVIEQHTADHFDLGPGDDVSIVGVGRVEIVGVGVSPEWLWIAPNQQELLVDPDEFGVLFAPETLAALAAPGETQLVVGVAGHDKKAIDAIATTAINEGAGEVLTQATHPSNSALQGDLAGFDQLSIMFPVLFLAAAGMATTVLLGRLVTQQRAEIGMLRANGYSTRIMQRHFATYGVVVSLLGAIPAIPIGVIGGWFATRAYTDFLGVPYASRQLHATTWVFALVFAVVVGAFAGAMPARAATRVDPATAMRPGGGMVAGKHSVLERALPRRSPSWIRVAVRNLGRQPGRAATTAIGVILALVLTMTAFVLNDTMNDMFTTQFNETDLRGLVVTLDRPVDTDVTNELAAIDGVSVAEPHLEIGAAFVSDNTVVTERLQIYATGTELHNFGPVGGLPSDGLVLSAGAAGDLQVGVGDPVELRTLDGTSGPVNVAAIITEPFTGSSYLSAEAWESIDGPTPRTAAIGLETRDDHRAVRDLVASLDGVEQISDRVATAERAEELLAASRLFVGVILLLAVVMAIALIFNALSVTIGERETEVATLQANGVGRSWIRRAITTENIVTVGIGLVPGLLLGRLSAGLFVGQFSTDQFELDPVLNPTSLIGAVIIVIVCALIAQVPGLRRLDRLDLAAKVRERAL
jgi:putative ABC transport system permease protein